MEVKKFFMLLKVEYFQKLLIAVAQVKVSNAYENLLNEIKQIKYSLH